MKNRRNTRRGRAKRWTQPLPGVWRIRGTGVTVLRFAPWDNWQAFDCEAELRCDAARSHYRPNRAAAMRAAEHLARGLK